MSAISQFTPINTLNEQLIACINTETKTQSLSKITEVFKTTIEKSISTIDGTLNQINKIDQQQTSFFNQRIILQKLPIHLQTILPTIKRQYNSNESLMTLLKNDCLGHSSKVSESINLLGEVIEKEENREQSKSGIFWLASKVYDLIFGSSIEKAKKLKTDLSTKLAKLNVTKTCESYVTEIRQNKIVFEHLLTGLKKAHTEGESQETLKQLIEECRDMGGKSGLSSEEITKMINDQLTTKNTV